MLPKNLVLVRVNGALVKFLKIKLFLVGLDKSTDRFDSCQKDLEKYDIEFDKVPIATIAQAVSFD